MNSLLNKIAGFIGGVSLILLLNMQHIHFNFEKTDKPIASNRPYRPNVNDAFVPDMDELHCLALNIYHESRSESILGQAMVAQVTKARVENTLFPDSFCKVIKQPKQFSWVKNGVMPEPDLKNDEEIAAWELANTIAYAMMATELNQSMADVMYYHTDKVNPRWSRKMRNVMTIGAHKFFAER